MKDADLLRKLRAATAVLHERLEQQNTAQAILDHSIDLESYKILLLQNYKAYRHLEAQIANFLPQLKSDKAARLKIDLEALEAPQDHNLPSKLKINNLAEAFGAAYVVEGSALGGMLIARHLSKCEQLKELVPQQFFKGDKACLVNWNFFKQELARQNFNQREVEELLAKAKETFIFFESIYRNTPCLTTKEEN